MPAVDALEEMSTARIGRHAKAEAILVVHYMYSAVNCCMFFVGSLLGAETGSKRGLCWQVLVLPVVA
jgi:hypothetical protein